MSDMKRPGVYMIYIKPEKKAYIGESKNIGHRIQTHIWATTSNKDYKSTKGIIAKKIREYGLENAVLYVLESGDHLADHDTRLKREAYYITKYCTDNPKYGYNRQSDQSTLAQYQAIPRKQDKLERLRRSSPAYLYDTKTERTLLFLGGCKAIGKYLGFTKEKQYGKDVTSHAKKKGILFLGRYYIIPARSEERKKVCDEIHKKKVLNEDNSRRERSIKVSTRAFNEYKKVVDYIDSFSMDEFGL